MTQKFKPTNRQQQQQLTPALPRAEKKLNEQINKQKTTITYSNNNYKRLVIEQNNMQTICRSDKQPNEANHTLLHTHTVVSVTVVC